MDEATRKKLQLLAAGASAIVPSPLGDVIGAGGDMLDPANRNLKGVGNSLMGVLPGVPSLAMRRIGARMMGPVSDYAKARAKDMPEFEDQMRMVRTVLDQQRAAKAAAAGPKKLDHLFDAEKGIGAVPDNQDIDRLGAVYHMRPSEYLALAEPLTRPSQRSMEHVRKGILNGEKLGQPRLSVDVVNGKPKVVNHDGRHRATVLQELYGDDVLIPVHVKGVGQHRDLPKKVPPSLYEPQRDADAELAALLRRADEMLQMRKDRQR